MGDRKITKLLTEALVRTYDLEDLDIPKNVGHIRTCGTCKYAPMDEWENPCVKCARNYTDQWEAKEEQ